MIAKARTIPHGNAYTIYSTLKRDSIFVCSLNLDGDMLLDPNDSMDYIWDEFKDENQKYNCNGKEIKNTMIAMEVSPTMDESNGWNLEDWKDYGIDLLRHVDNIEFQNKMGKVSAPKTNLLKSKVVMMLHTDSKSGIMHMHLMCSRFTIDGGLNCGNLIGMKAVVAANQINQERGWKQPEEISREHKAEIKNVCYEILRNMKTWNMNTYLDEINKAGYKTKTREDESNNIVSYWIFWGNSRYRASDIGANLTAKKLQKEWQKLHPKRNFIDTSKTSRVSSVQPSYKPIDTSVHTYDSHVIQEELKSVDVSWETKYPKETKRQYMEIPSSVYDFFSAEAADTHFVDAFGREIAVDSENIINTAVMLYLGYIQDATTYSESFGGGGGAPSGGWGRDNDDDDEWARRCMIEARRMSKPKLRIGRKR